MQSCGAANTKARRVTLSGSSFRLARGQAAKLVQGAQHILGPFGVDCDLRRWGLKLAERGGRNGKKRAIIATARKLAVLLHHLWVSGEAYEPLHNSQRRSMVLAA
jgi:transposase